MRNKIVLTFLIILPSCNIFDERKMEVFKTDIDFVENYREFSPDSSMLLINYSLDQGAFGYGQVGTAILKLSDTTKNLRNFSIPNDLSEIKWLDDKNISAKYDIIPSVRAGKKIVLKDKVVNNIKIKISAIDYIDQDDQLEIEHRETSPNGKFELVAYRYLKSRSEIKFIHISVIPAGNEIPKYGNFFIANGQSDYIFNATWNNNNELKFYSNSSSQELVQYYFVENRPKIKYKILYDDKKYGSEYRWTK